jgi:hypothetical protein
MVDVRLPDGKVAAFPETMPRGEIKAFIAFKYPDAGIKYDPNDLLRAQIRFQNAKNQASGPQPQVENNPVRSSLPGPIGQFQDMSSAFQRGAIEGMTGNMSDELFAGAVAPIDATVRAAQGQPFDIGDSFGDLYAGSSTRRQQEMALNPQAAGAGNLTGALVLGKSLGGLSPTSLGTTPLRMGALGALEGGAYGALYGIGGAEGNVGERAVQALPEIGMGVLTGGAVGYGAGALGPRISNEARTINRGLAADQIDPSSIQARINAINPDAAVLADLGPNLQGQAAALATTPGPASRVVNEALTARRLGANERVRTGVSDILGDPPTVSGVTAEIDAQRKLINQQYEPVFRAKALSPDPFTDITPIYNSVQTRLTQLPNGETKSALTGVLRRLTDDAGNAIRDPQMVMAVRQDLDGIINSAETNNTVKGALRTIRRELDDALGTSVPGLKDIDAQFAEVARQGETFEQGRNVLGTGQNAIDPVDLIEQMKGASTGQNVRLSQGTRAEINRIIGTKANDRVALQGIIRGDGSWNAQKLRTLFGEEKANRLMALVDSEATMAATENLATSGSRTQVLKAGQDDFAIRQSPSIMHDALDLRFGNVAARMADNVLGGALAARREVVNENVAKMLMDQGIPPQIQQEIARLTFGLPANQRQAIAAAIAGGVSTQSQEPMRIVVDGAGSYGGARN